MRECVHGASREAPLERRDKVREEKRMRSATEGKRKCDVRKSPEEQLQQRCEGRNGCRG